MLSQEFLAGNIEALTRVQGRCPTLAALRTVVRVTTSGTCVSAELCTGPGEWQPLDEGSQWVQSVDMLGSRQMVLIGVGLGDALEAAERRGVTRVLVIEPDPGLATLFLSRRDLRQRIAEGRMRLLTGPDYRGDADVARFLNGLLPVPIASNPQRLRLEPQAIAPAVAVAERIARNARANGDARRRFAGPYLLQTLGNLHSIAHEADVTALDGAFRRVPAIVAGAGPSLDRNIEELRPFQDRGVIVAADTSLGPMLRGGVRPHVVVGVDSSALNARHLTETPAPSDVALAAEGSLHPTALQRFAGRTFTFRVSNHEPWPWLAEAGITRGELRTWGSVLTSAFDLARRMGCSPIIFAGADLAFTDMRPYCRGTIYDAMWQEWIDKGCTWEQLMTDYFSRQPDIRVPDVHGANTRTAPHLRSFRDWLVEQTRQTAETTFINATGGGILHGGSLTQASLADALGSRPAQPDIRHAIRLRHAVSRLHSTDPARLAGLLSKAHTPDGSIPFERWMTFAASTVTADQIEHHLSLASRPLSVATC